MVLNKNIQEKKGNQSDRNNHKGYVYMHFNIYILFMNSYVLQKYQFAY